MRHRVPFGIPVGQLTNRLSEYENNFGCQAQSRAKKIHALNTMKFQVNHPSKKCRVCRHSVWIRSAYGC